MSTCRTALLPLLLTLVAAPASAAGAARASTPDPGVSAHLLFPVLPTSKEQQPAQAAQSAPAAPAVPEDDPDLDVNPLQPDFTLLTMPTTLRMPKGKSAFRVTHRFTRSLGQGDFGNLLEDLFGIDSGAVIGLEYRYGLLRGADIGIRRTNDRTIEFFTKYNVLQERGATPLGLSVIASAEGTNNFRDSYTPSLGVVVSRSVGRAGTVYVEPVWVNNSNALPSALANDNDSFVVGMGARMRIRPSLYLVGELVPRVTGYEPNVNHASVGFEKLLGLHVFQFNLSNGFGTTTGQVTRGGTGNHDWYFGFSISRKFF